MRVLPGVIFAGVAATAAHAQVDLDAWFFQINYGVFADGGSVPTPLQGPVSVDDVGEHEFSWSQEDGVAFAEATAVATILIDSPDGSLYFGGGLQTSAEAVVGDDPSYPFEFATAESFLDYAFLAINVQSPSVLTVSGTPVELNGIDTFDPGDEVVLEPGFYEIEFSGAGSLSKATAHADESDFDMNAWAFGVRVDVIPAPAGLVVLLIPAIVSRRAR